MDEDLNDNELEERLYAMLHHVDETQSHYNATDDKNANDIIENAPRSTLRRYWRTSGDRTPLQIQPQKQIVQEESIPTPNNPITPNKAILNVTNPKEEEQVVLTAPCPDLSIFKTTPQIIKKSIEILEHDISKPVLLESSDEDEVIEVELPPKPTITIESSDEDEVCIITNPDSLIKDQEAQAPILHSSGDRDSTSPVPSVVSSVSDEFIRSDCIALNISSRNLDKHDFDFSQHGTDLLGQTTPTSKKKKRKKAKEIATSTPVVTVSNSKNIPDECFATPKSKAKHKKQKSKSYSVFNKSLPNADVYDSDSNHSTSAVINTKNNEENYIVTDKSLPSADVYESDSNQSETIKETVNPKSNTNKNVDNSDSNISVSESSKLISRDNANSSKPSNSPQILDKTSNSIVDLTTNDEYITLDRTDITESIVMGNVTGFKEVSDEDEHVMGSAQKLGSTKIPSILYDNLDFDNFKGKDKVCKKRRYSLTTLRAEMEKFYNESWGGEEFNHREIQKYMSRDKSLWVIDPKDRMPALSKRRLTCHYCNRPGHRDDMCRMKPPVCYMCGSSGHNEPRCPAKMCVNCGSPNYMYSTMCRNCCTWQRIICAECGQYGHPASHCPDTWRRYHNTTDINMPLEENWQTKKHPQLYCSGCTRRGHLVHTCRITLPFSGLPINSPYVSVYRPLYMPTPNSENSERGSQRKEKQTRSKPEDSTIVSVMTPNNRNKRQSKSPSVQDNQMEAKKKKSNSISDSQELSQNINITSNNRGPRKISNGKELTDEPVETPAAMDKALDFIPISSTNHDKKGQMIQDNEVSDTSEAITVARIFITQDLLNRLETTDGKEWLGVNTEKHNVSVINNNGEGPKTYLSVKAKIADQEAFQVELKKWTAKKQNADISNAASNSTDHDNSNLLLHGIPKKRIHAFRYISRALDLLKTDLGDPKALYKDLTYLQNQHQNLLKQKVISPTVLSNNRDHINGKIKKLNMVLLGQAGLANGTQHIKKLHLLRQKLTMLKVKTITPEIRKEIGQHYQCIFTAVERSDYAKLLEEYHCTKSPGKQRIVNKLKSNIIPPQQRGTIENTLMKENTGATNGKPGRFNEGIKLKSFLYYHKVIKKTRPQIPHLKKQKRELMRKLHSQIVALYTKEQVNSKTLKKMDILQGNSDQYLNALLQICPQPIF